MTLVSETKHFRLFMSSDILLVEIIFISVFKQISIVQDPTYQYYWDFNDGNGWVLKSALFDHTFPEDDLRDRIPIQLEIRNSLGDVVASSVYQLHPNLSSPDINGGILELDDLQYLGGDQWISEVLNTQSADYIYEWNFGDSTGVHSYSSAIMNYTFPPDTSNERRHIGSLTVLDGTDTISTIDEIVFNWKKVDVSFEMIGNKLAQFDLEIDSGISVDHYEWSFGDNSPITSSSQLYQTHTYPEVGAYTLTVVAKK